MDFKIFFLALSLKPPTKKMLKLMLCSSFHSVWETQHQVANTSNDQHDSKVVNISG